MPPGKETEDASYWLGFRQGVKLCLLATDIPFGNSSWQREGEI